MNPSGYQETIKTAGQFWQVSAPITIFMFLIMSVFLYRPDEKIKNWLEDIIVLKIRTPKIETKGFAG